MTLYLLITLSAVSRVTAPFMPDFHLPLLMFSGVIWIAVFSLFIASDGRALFTVGQ